MRLGPGTPAEKVTPTPLGVEGRYDPMNITYTFCNLDI